MAEGEAKGRLDATRTILRRLLEKRFGSLPEGLSHRIQACDDLEQLLAAAVQAEELKKLDDLQL
jgi:hypothetical protein